jgi:hypothetical protein
MRRLISWATATSILTALLTALVVGPTATPASAAAPGGNTSAGPQQNCVVVVDKLRPGQQVSDILQTRCSTDPAFSALICGDPLVRMYENLNYGGYGYTFCGGYGTCDAAGYGFRDMGGFGNNILSSFKVYDACKFVRIYDSTGFGNLMVTYYGNRSYVGDQYNDRTSSFRISA